MAAQRPARGQVAGRAGTGEAVLRELVDADLPAVVGLCREALHLPEDAAEVAQIVERLRTPPAGQRTVAKVAVSASGSPPGMVGVVLASLSHLAPAAGHIDLVAVHPRLRRRGIGRALLVAAETALAGYGTTEVLLGGNMPYGWPGIDVRYTPAICAALALGYAQDRTAWNMTVDLSRSDAPALRGLGPAQDRLAAEGIAVRPAAGADIPALTGLIRAHFSVRWVWEVAQSIGRDSTGCHVAVDSAGEILGFAAYGAIRPSWFGPMGTAPAARGKGIGEVLLRRCLVDLRAAGHRRAQIGWAGPVPFYSRTVDAHIERVFCLYRKDL